MIRIALALALLAGTAFADKIDPAVQAKADVLFEKAQANYQSGQFQAAIELFQQAYELVHDPIYLFNLAQSYRKVLDCEAASDYYTRYLDAAPNAENKAKVKQWLTELQPCVEQRQKEHEAAKRGEEAERLRREDEQRRRAQAAAPHETEVDTGGPYRVSGMIVGGVGVLGLAAGIVYGIKSENIKQDLATQCMASCHWGEDPVKTLDSDGRRDNTIAKAGYIGGGIAAIVGAGLYVFGLTRSEMVTITPAEGGATVSARLSF